MFWQVGSGQVRSSRVRNGQAGKVVFGEVRSGSVWQVR